MRSAWRLALIGAIGLVAVTTSAPVAVPQEAPGVLLVLDASGSMNATDDTGRTLLEGAQDSLVALVETLPDGGVEVGLRVYGHRTSNDDRVRGCQDSELVVPVGPLDRVAMIEAIRDVQASGYTPIGLSLTQAAEDLAGRAAATVILVSDGEDTCAPPDPCEVAAGLADSGLTVNTIGFYIEEGSIARGQLQCIADVTGGSYRDVNEADNLAGVVGVLIQEVPGVGNLHLPLNGATTRALAPFVALVPAGQNDGQGLQAAVNTPITAGETRWFSVEVEEGAVISIATDTIPFIAAAIPEPGDEVILSIVDEGGESVAGIEWFGLGRIELGTALAIDLPFFNGLAASSDRGINPWSNLEPVAQEGWEALGVTEDAWNRSMRDRYRYLRPEPLPAGRYDIGITWQSNLDVETRADLLIGVWRGDLDGWSDPLLLEGSTDPAEALFIEEQFAPYASWLIPLIEDDPSAELYTEGPIVAGETRWFAMDIEWDETLWVEALLNVPDSQPLDETDRLAIEIIDPTGADVTHAHPYVGFVSGTVEELPAYERLGYHPRPRVAAAAREPGPNSPPPGEYLVGVTWEGEGSEGMLEIRLGGGGLDGMVEMERVVPTTAQIMTTVAAAADDAEGSGGIDMGLVFVGVIAVLGVLGAAVVVSRRK